MPKKVLIAIAPAMLEQVDQVAEQEHRTRSDLIREALRRYLFNVEAKTTKRNAVILPPAATITATDFSMRTINDNRRKTNRGDEVNRSHH